jgi:hypothetical protein
MVKAGMDPRDATDAERYRALRLLHDRPVVQAGLPSAGRVSLLRQRREGRYVAHLLYCPPIARGRCLVLEDFPRLADVPVVLRLPGTVRALCLEPDGIPLPFDRRTETSGFLAGSDVVTTRVPSFAMHCAVVADLVSAAG